MTWLLRIGLLLLSTTLALAVSEGVARLAVEPVNFLKPEVELDDVLRWRVVPGSAGHDAWGFRNREVPERAQIVALGDSQTYGHGASASQSWPAWLQELTGRRVYNLALSGYGPVDYRALADKAFELEPETLVVGLYFGNDLMDAWRSTYTMEHWRFLRDSDWLAAHPDALDSTKANAKAKRKNPWKEWFGHHSVVYRMTVLALSQSALVLPFRAEPDQDLLRLEIPPPGGPVTLNPVRRMRALDRGDPRVGEGLRLTLESLGAIQAACREQSVELVVLLIPTKISVFAAHLPNTDEPLAEVATALSQDENAARLEIQTWLAANGVIGRDALGPLASRAASEPLYPAGSDGHPTGAGYRVLAETVADVFENSSR